MKSGAEILISTMESFGVKTLTGIPGGAVLPIYDALSGSSIRHILARSEQGAAFIAQGMARTTGTPAVTIATSGPGAANLITALADAKLDCVPIIAITGQVSKSLIGKDSFQEIDIVAISAPVTKKSFFIERAADIAGVFEEAWHLSASGKPGPVLIDIPKDVQTEMACIYPHAASFRENAKTPSAASLKKAAQMINSSQRPVIISGGGINQSRTQRLLLDFAQKANIPVAATLMGLGSFPSDSGLYSGFIGMHGDEGANLIIHESDLIIAIGSRFGDRSTGRTDMFAPDADFIQIDADENECGKIIDGVHFIHSTISEFFAAATPLVKYAEREKWIGRINRIKEKAEDRGEDADHPASVIKTISDAADDDAIIVTDVGQHQMWTARNFRFSPQRPLVTSGGLGTMGFGLPAAIGASIANPGRQIILITGDGSIMMNIQEMALLRMDELNIKIFVMNNSHLGLVRQQQELFYGEKYFACRFDRCEDFARIADAFGIKNMRADGGEIRECLEKMRETGTMLADVRIRQHELVLPMVPPGKANTEMIKTRPANSAACSSPF